MTDQQLVTHIAKYLCKEADDDWSLGKKLYTGQADEIMATVRESDRASRSRATLSDQPLVREGM